jgi:hypothetical protein
LLLVEWLVERNDWTGIGAISDVHMMTVTSEGRERGRAELERLLASSRFRTTRVLPSPTISVIEAVAE